VAAAAAVGGYTLVEAGKEEGGGSAGAAGTRERREGRRRGLLYTLHKMVSHLPLKPTKAHEGPNYVLLRRRRRVAGGGGAAGGWGHTPTGAATLEGVPAGGGAGQRGRWRWPAQREEGVEGGRAPAREAHGWEDGRQLAQA